MRIVTVKVDFLSLRVLTIAVRLWIGTDLPSRRTFADLILMPLGSRMQILKEPRRTQPEEDGRPKAVPICCGVAPVSGGVGVEVGIGVGEGVGSARPLGW